MLTLTLALAVGIGVLLGLLGGGGSILTVPLLVYVAAMPPHEAVTTSLLVVGTTSAVAAVPHARQGHVRWRPALVLGAGAMVGAYAGGRLAAHVPGAVLMVAFAVLMLAAAVPMIRGRGGSGEEPVEHPVPTARALAIGVAVGLATGFVGAGGGFLVVPALVLLAGLPMGAAVGTSLVVIALNSAAGLAGHLGGTAVSWPFALAVTAATLVGALLGARLSARVPPERLRVGFGALVLVMGLFVLGENLLTR